MHTNSRTDSPSPHRSLCQQVHSFLRARSRCVDAPCVAPMLCDHDTSDRLLPSHHFKTSTRTSRVPAASAGSRRTASRGDERFTTPESLERYKHDFKWGVVFPNRSARPPLTSRRRRPICSMPLARALALGRRQVRFSSRSVKNTMFHEQRCLRFWQVLLLEASSIRTTLPPYARRSTSLRNTLAIVCHAAGVIRRYFRCARLTVTHLAVFLAEIRFSESDAACPLLQHT